VSHVRTVYEGACFGNNLKLLAIPSFGSIITIVRSEGGSWGISGLSLCATQNINATHVLWGHVQHLGPGTRHATGNSHGRRRATRPP
jgi:hypothetical protein